MILRLTPVGVQMDVSRCEYEVIQRALCTIFMRKEHAEIAQQLEAQMLEFSHKHRLLADPGAAESEASAGE